MAEMTTGEGRGTPGTLWPGNLSDEEFRAVVAKLNAEVLGEIAAVVVGQIKEEGEAALRPYGTSPYGRGSGER